MQCNISSWGNLKTYCKGLHELHVSALCDIHVIWWNLHGPTLYRPLDLRNFNWVHGQFVHRIGHGLLVSESHGPVILYDIILYYTILYTIHTIKCRHSAQCGHRNVGSFKRRSWNFAAPRSPCPPSWPKLGWTKPGKWGWKLSHGDIIEVSWVIKWRSNGDIVGNW